MRLFIISGATATGKSALAQALATLTGADIISIDSMKVYRGMDIGTDKPSQKIQNRIPHHMIDVVEPSERYDVARYISDSYGVIQRLKGRRVPFLLEGGTPLYIKALTEGIFEGVPADYAFREKLLEEANRSGVEILYERLRRIDPISASKIHRNDLKRVIRALEVYKATGKTISELKRQFGRIKHNYFMLILWRSNDELRELIRARIKRIFKEGFIEEVRMLLESDMLGPTASQAAGYAEAAAYIRGECTLEEAERRTEKRHWQLARRQMTWLRRFRDACHICIKGKVDYNRFAKEVYGLYAASTTLSMTSC